MKKMMLAALFVVLGSISVQASDNWQHWNWTSLNLYKTEKWKFGILLDNRYSEGLFDDSSFKFGSGKVTYMAHKNLDLGFNLSYYKSETSKGWKNGIRYEFEINPKMTLDNGIALHMRNRLEIRDIEDKGESNNRTRHRIQVTIPIKTDFECFKGFYANNEFFINWDDNIDRFNENRIQPIGLKFKFNKHIGFNLFYMIQSKRKRNNDSWTDNNAIGTHLIVNF